MKSLSFAVLPLRWASVCLAVMSCAGAARAEEPLRGEALLVWATNEPRSPDPKHIPVDENLAKKLTNSPYRWKYYYEVPPRQALEISVGETQKNVRVSKHCSLDVKNLGKNRVEVRLYGEGKPVVINSEPFEDQRLLIYAGPAGNETGWLVVIRKTKVHVAKAENAGYK